MFTTHTTIVRAQFINSGLINRAYHIFHMLVDFECYVFLYVPGYLCITSSHLKFLTHSLSPPGLIIYKVWKVRQISRQFFSDFNNGLNNVILMIVESGKWV